MVMAKLIYESDTGRIEYDIPLSVIKTLKNQYNVDALNEIWDAFKEEIEKAEKI
jgi:hypothetical protein